MTDWEWSEVNEWRDDNGEVRQEVIESLISNRFLRTILDEITLGFQIAIIVFKVRTTNFPITYGERNNKEVSTICRKDSDA